MKIYEKPMVTIEKIEVEDVITASPALEAGNFANISEEDIAVINKAAGITTQYTIVAQW